MRPNSLLSALAVAGALGVALGGCGSSPAQPGAEPSMQGSAAAGATGQGAGMGGMGHGEPGAGAGMGGMESGAGPGSAAAAGTPGQMGPGMGMGMMRHRQAMCDMVRNVMSARTPEQRQQLLEQYMGGMAPEERERHLAMMQQHCGQ